MSLVSFLIYVWAKVVHVLDEHEIPSSKEKRSWSPREVKEFIQTHQTKLAKAYPEQFKEGNKLTFQALDVLIQRSPNRELTMNIWDSDYETHELVYGVCKDSVNRRITVVFRGTESSSNAMKSNWNANLDVGKAPETLPTVLEGKLLSGRKKVWIHKGFHEFMNKPTEDPTDHVSRTKKQQVIDSVKKMVKRYPDYKVYVTGHSLGAALATLTSYYLATDVDSKTGKSIIPTPVTCINFASPRIGDGVFLEAVQVLERQGKLRICRFVNHKDLVCAFPTLNYKHVGFMVKMKSKPGKLAITYPKPNEGWGSWLERAVGMSWPAAFNLKYDHSAGEYGRRVEIHRKQLEDKDLVRLYRGRQKRKKGSA